jgi:hypothetical protein
MGVAPGEYTITLALAGKTETKTVSVSDDPRIPFSDSDRAKRKAAVDRLSAMGKSFDTSRRKIVAMQTTVQALIDSWKRPAAPSIPDTVKKYADDLLARIKRVATPTFEAEPDPGPRLLGFAGAPLGYTPPPVNQQITRLAGSISGYPAAPNAKQLTDLDQIDAELKAGMAEIDKLDGEIPKLNKMMTEAGVPYITIDPASVPPPAGGRGGN